MMTNAVTVSINKYTSLQITELKLHISVVNVMNNCRLAFPEKLPMKTHFREVEMKTERPLNFLL